MLTLADWTVASYRLKIYCDKSVTCTWALISLTFLPALLFSEVSSLVTWHGDASLWMHLCPPQQGHGLGRDHKDQQEPNQHVQP